MIPATDLPVWTIPPNWSNGVRETLSWLTDVMQGENRAEQRRSVRLTPRRSFEFDFLLTGPRRTFLDLIASKLSVQEWMVPLWHDQSKVSSEAASGQATVAVDTTYREFRVGDYAVIMGPDIWTYERIEITAVNAGNLVAAANLTATWPVGSMVFPLRRMAMYGDVSISSLTSRVGESTIGFETNQENGFDEGVYAGLTYTGYPVLTTAPDYKIKPDTEYERQMQMSDSKTGLKHFFDQADRSFPRQDHSYLLVGRQERFEFRQFLYRMRGMAKPAWLPSYNEDIVLTADVAIGEQILDIEKIGYAFAGGIETGRKFILLTGASGSEVVEVTSTGAEPSAGEERLNLSAVLTKGFEIGDTGSFIEVARLAQDRVEIVHHTDADGAAECRLSYATFPDVRDASGTIYLPVPTGEMVAGTCGEPDSLSCLYEPPPLYEGWDHEWTLEVDAIGGPVGLASGSPVINGPAGYPGNVGGFGGIDINDPTGPDQIVWERITTGEGTALWRSVWKINNPWPSGTYEVLWDPSAFSDNVVYRVRARKWSNPDPTLLDEYFYDGGFLRRRTFLSGDS